MPTVETVLPSCPDEVPWCGAHELVVDVPRPGKPPAYSHYHNTAHVHIPATPGQPFREFGDSDELVLATVRGFRDPDNRAGPMVEVAIKPETSGSPDLLWATPAEARALAAELVRAADLIDDAQRLDSGSSSSGHRSASR